ncbi:MAG: hypothetical protein MHM6MM_001271 [Cercozoa sp. M6MM]
MFFLASLLIAGVVAQNDCSDTVCPDVEHHLCVEHVGTDVVMTVRNTCTLEFLRCMYGEENIVLVNEGDCQNGETTTVGLDLDSGDAASLLSDDYYDDYRSRRGHGRRDRRRRRHGSGYDEPRYEEPSYKEPRYEEPSYKEPSYKEPSYDEPSYEEPSYDEPDYSEYDDSHRRGRRDRRRRRRSRRHH